MKVSSTTSTGSEELFPYNIGIIHDLYFESPIIQDHIGIADNSSKLFLEQNACLFTT